MPDPLHIMKLCVGADAVEDLEAWQRERMAAEPGRKPVHVTRMWPRRADEVLAGGSIYWVFRGVMLARQRILALEERRGADGIPRCGIVLDPALVRIEPVPRRAFQGWRYLTAADAPRDLARVRASDDALPADLSRTLAEIGLF